MYVRSRIICATENKINDTWNKVNNSRAVIQLIDTLDGVCDYKILFGICVIAQKTGLEECHELIAVSAIVGQNFIEN